MNRDLWILQLHDAAHRVGELPVFIYQQVLQVVVHASVAIDDNSRPPNHAVQHRREELRRIDGELPHDVRVPLEQIVQTVIVPGTIRADCDKILQHHLSGLQVARIYGHVQRRNGLGADRDIQNPHRPFRTRSIGQCTPYLLGIVCVDGLHDKSRTLLDGPHQELGNQAKRPPKGVCQIVVACQLLEDLCPAFNERIEEVRRDSIAHVSQAQGRDCIHSLDGLLVQIQRELDGLVRDEVQSCGRLFEVLFSTRGQLEETIEHFFPDLLA
mmetsp:Transcript_92506/g.220153  ORF Transcript_92506/g.220153 Transcript_92506/m.220153 type:complete len:269 (-) Transcript_92506:1704-2510(-)